MHSEEYERMYRLEDSYWWFVGRHELALGFMREAFPSRSDLTVLDIGCGTGAMSKKLTPWGRVVSADYSSLALSYSRRRGLDRLCVSDAMRLPFQSATFDVVFALDVLEHVKDDEAALCEIQRVVKPGGLVMATVPAYQSLWSSHDVALMHYRRYVAHQVAERVTRAHLRVRRLSYAMTLLFPIVWVFRRLLDRRRGEPKASLVNVPGFANSLLIHLLGIENALIRHVRLPFGVTVFCMAERP